MTERADAELVPLYILLYLDEDVSVGIARNLQARGFNATCARDQDALQQTDEAQLAYAVSQHRAIFTHNRLHFEEQHRKYLESGHTHYGIIVAKRRPKDAEVVARLLHLLNNVTAEEIANQIRYI